MEDDSTFVSDTTKNVRIFTSEEVLDERSIFVFNDEIFPIKEMTNFIKNLDQEKALFMHVDDKINEYFEDYDIKPFETKQNEEAERETENEVEREEISKEEVQKGEMKQEEPFKEKVREIREKFDDILNKK